MTSAYYLWRVSKRKFLPKGSRVRTTYVGVYLKLHLIRNIISLALCLTSISFANQISITTETVHSAPGSEVYVRLFCSADFAISALHIPIEYPASASAVIDSVSFVNSVFADLPFILNVRESDSKRGPIAEILPNAFQGEIPSLRTSGGEICRIHLHLPANAETGFVEIDSFYVVYHVGPLTYYDRLDASDSLGTTVLPAFTPGGIWIDHVTAVDGDGPTLPHDFSLDQNYPNPFNPSTQISFYLPKASQVSLEVFNILGAKVSTLAQGYYTAGRQSVIWDAAGFPSGIYFYRFTTPSAVLTKKLSLIK